MACHIRSNFCLQIHKISLDVQHPNGKPKRGCRCDLCQADKPPPSPYSPQLVFKRRQTVAGTEGPTSLPPLLGIGDPSTPTTVRSRPKKLSEPYGFAPASFETCSFESSSGEAEESSDCGTDLLRYRFSLTFRINRKLLSLGLLEWVTSRCRTRLHWDTRLGSG